MLKNIKINCDRCGLCINGYFYIDSDFPSRSYTTGYYDVSSGYWRNFARENEKIVCDGCMISSEEYKKMHG